MNDCSYETDAAADLFSVLSDGTRMRILRALADGPMCVCDLVELCGVSQSGVSHQLRVLREAGLVGCERRGRHSFYAHTDAKVTAFLADAGEQARRLAALERGGSR